MTAPPKLALQDMSIILKSMPAPDIIHAGGHVFLWKGNDNGRSPTHWNLVIG